MPWPMATSVLLSFVLPLVPFFGSTAPQAFFRPDRKMPRPPRAAAVKVGRRSAHQTHCVASRPRLDSSEHGGTIDPSGPSGA